MLRSRPIRLCTCLAMLFSLAYCRPSSNDGTGGSSQPGTTTSSTSTSTGGATTPTGGNTSASGSTSSAGSASIGGTKAPGGSSTSAGGTTSEGGSTSAAGTKVTGGSTSAGGTTTSSGGTAGGTKATGGTTSAGGTVASGGTTSTASTATANLDCNQQPLAKPGDSTSTSRKYLNLGDMRLIDNRWGSDALGCSGTQMKVSVNSDKTIGYDFNRPTCGGKKADPDYPEIEFGVAPFGKGSADLTSPDCSSTTLLPIQLSKLNSASVNIENFASNFSNPTYYDTNFEFWISKNNPLDTSQSPGVYAEIIAFLGWNGDRMSSPNGWPCKVDKAVSVTAGSTGFTLCHNSDTWSNGRWRFFNFNVNNGPMSTFSGKVDIKAMLTAVMNTYSGFTTDMWLTRIEVGSEIDDSTAGTAKISNLTFEINGTSKSIELGQ